MRRLLWFLPWVLAACGGGQTERRFVEMSFDTAFVFGGPADTVAEPVGGACEPFWMVSWPPTGTQVRLVFISGDGTMCWLHEQRGTGTLRDQPAPGMVVESASGTLYVLDANNVKLVELSAEGAPIREERLPSLPGIPWGLVEARAGELLLMDARGRGLRWWPWKGGGHPMNRWSLCPIRTPFHRVD